MFDVAVLQSPLAPTVNLQEEIVSFLSSAGPSSALAIVMQFEQSPFREIMMALSQLVEEGILLNNGAAYQLLPSHQWCVNAVT